MSILALNNVSKSYDSRVVLKDVAFGLGATERVGLVGPNGEGKSTLLRLLAGVVEPDEGRRIVSGGARVGYFSQEVKLDPALSVRQGVRAGLGDRDALNARLAELHGGMSKPGADTKALIAEQTKLESRLAQMGGHAVDHRVDDMMTRLGLHNPDASCGSLSGGEARRVALAALLLSEPDVLLLDEPTNHLDVVAIQWLEDFLMRTRVPLVMVTHDRYFLNRIVRRIIEIDRGKLYSTDGGYQDYLAAQAVRLAAESNTEATRLSIIRRETAWIKRGAHGRTTKEKARVARYNELTSQDPLETRAELAFEIPPGPRLGGKVIRAEKVGKRFGERVVLNDISLEIQAGMRLGIVGANGTGKTTLLKTLIGQLTPDSGSVEIGTTVRVASIDQSRTVLDEDKSVVEEVAKDHDEIIKVAGRDQRVAPFLDQFLFKGERKHTLIRKLSGGERNRVLLAKLLLQCGNVIALDEPTNDLDLPTLRALEEALCAFEGVVLVVSHDRYFIDRVCTRVLYLDGSGNARFHEGDIEELLSELQRDAEPEAAPKPKSNSSANEDRKAKRKAEGELKKLPERIEKLEARCAKLDEELADPNLYTSDEGKAKAADLASQREAITSELEQLYARWEELEEMLAS